MRYVSLIALAFLLAKVGGAKSQCSVAKVCGVLDNVLRQQDLIGKKLTRYLEAVVLKQVSFMNAFKFVFHPMPVKFRDQKY